MLFEIDKKRIDVPSGTTILAAARSIGIDIPTMCHVPGKKPLTSCMLCLVKIASQGGRFAPACATMAEDGMAVESETPAVHALRRSALELMLSDHVGDCIGPCQAICPGKLDVPLMIRQIAAGDFGGAIETIKQTLALPATLGRICPAPCQNGCRRASHDGTLQIRLLRRHVADWDAAAATRYMPAKRPPTGKKVAVVGAGPTGLAATYYLLASGYAVRIFDDHPAPGGLLRYGLPPGKLDPAVLDGDIAPIVAMGAELRMGVRVGEGITLDDLRGQYDAVVLATGELPAGKAAALGVKTTAQGIEIDQRTCMTSLPGVFAGGDGVRRQRLTVRSCGDGRNIATCIDQYLTAGAVHGIERPFTVRMGPLQEGEMATFLRGASDAPQMAVAEGAGFTRQQAQAEAVRCLHCDCRKKDNCRLRDYSVQYSAKLAKFLAPRRRFEQRADHPRVIFESGKCVRCGICVRLAEEAAEKFGLSFIRRGYDAQVSPPTGITLENALAKCGDECVAYCPTAAFALK